MNIISHDVNEHSTFDDLQATFPGLPFIMNEASVGKGSLEPWVSDSSLLMEQVRVGGRWIGVAAGCGSFFGTEGF